KVPHSSACSPKNILARATISGFSPAAIRMSAFSIRSPVKRTIPITPSRPAILGSNSSKRPLVQGYSESLPNIGSTVDFDPPNYRAAQCVYARKHVPWISFANIPNGTTVETSSNLRFADFPRDYTMPPTVAFVIPNLNNDMHNGKPAQSIPAGDTWLRQNLDDYYQWAKRYRAHQSAHRTRPRYSPRYNHLLRALQNRVVTIFAGAHIKPGSYAEGRGITHVNVLRTIEAMYGLQNSGAQQPNAAGGGIADETIITDVFEFPR